MVPYSIIALWTKNLWHHFINFTDQDQERSGGPFSSHICKISAIIAISCLEKLVLVIKPLDTYTNLHVHNKYN